MLLSSVARLSVARILQRQAAVVAESSRLFSSKKESGTSDAPPSVSKKRTSKERKSPEKNVSFAEGLLSALKSDVPADASGGKTEGKKKQRSKKQSVGIVASKDVTSSSEVKEKLITEEHNAPSPNVDAQTDASSVPTEKKKERRRKRMRRSIILKDQETKEELSTVPSHLLSVPGAKKETQKPQQPKSPPSKDSNFSSMLMHSLKQSTSAESGETDMEKLKGLLSTLGSSEEPVAEVPKVDLIPEAEEGTFTGPSSDARKDKMFAGNRIKGADAMRFGRLIPGLMVLSAEEAAEELNQIRKKNKMTGEFEVEELEVKKHLFDFGDGQALGIFKKAIMDTASKETFVSIQEQEEMKELQDYHYKVGPRTGYVDMLREADRMWKYPVDNEVVKVEEEDVGFEEHIFLEDYLEEFPESVAVRNFMELVLTGLQQNPHMTAKEKQGHIYWFKDYFEKFSPEELEFS